MKFKTTLLTSLIATAPFVTQVAQADVYVIPRISVEQQTYETDFLYDGYTAPAIGVSLFSSDGIFLDAEGLAFTKDGDANQAGDQSSVILREEITLTAGYRFPSGIIFFTGYKKANTQGYDEDADKWTFDTAGPFFGISGSTKLHDKVQLGLSGALASMAGSINVKSFGATPSTESFDGDSFGFSASAALNTAFNESLIGSLGVKYQSYDYGDQIATEEISSIFVKLAYRF